MDYIAGKEKLLNFLKKYRYVALVVIVGLILMILPESGDSVSQQVPQETQPAENLPTAEERLAAILSQIEGAGKVQVLLTQSSGAETIYQTDQETVTGEESGSIRIDTVIVSDSDRGESGLVRQVNPPVYLGAVVVCQGADQPAVKLSIVDAVSKVTGLGSNKISVLKMK